MAAVRAAVGTSGRMAIRCHLACATTPTGVCGCVIAEAAPNGVLVLRKEHLATRAGGGRMAARAAEKHESRFTLYELMRLLLAVDGGAPVPLSCQVAGCEREVAQLIPGGILQMERMHYGELHVRRLGLFELMRRLLVADEQGG